MAINKNKQLLTFYHNNIIRLIIISTCNLLDDVCLAFIFSLYCTYTSLRRNQITNPDEKLREPQ